MEPDFTLIVVDFFTFNVVPWLFRVNFSAAFTVMVQVAFLAFLPFPALAVMVAVPLPLAVTSPFASTVATFFLEEDQ